MTDQWKAYNQLGQVGFTHLTINHSILFHLIPGSILKTEAAWGLFKKQLLQKGIRSGFVDYLLEYLWKRNIKRENSYGEHIVSFKCCGMALKIP